MKIRRVLIPTFFSSLFLFALTANAQTYQARSSAHPVALIELFTSQGCSSCPPAEKWLGNLEHSGISKDKAIPLALHVDYWDYIGWKDQFSIKYFTKRQYKHHRSGNSSSVYTPQIMLNGEDVRKVRLNRSISDLRNKTAAVDFSVKAETLVNDALKVNLTFHRIDFKAKNSNVIVVLAENNLVREIATGENAGRTLKHQHVVRAWKNIGKINGNLSTNLVLKPEWKKSNLDLVVIVETADLQTQQALSLTLK